MLLPLAYLGVTNTLAMLRLLPMSDRAKDAEILDVRHQIMSRSRGSGRHLASKGLHLALRVLFGVRDLREDLHQNMTTSLNRLADIAHRQVAQHHTPT